MPIAAHRSKTSSPSGAEAVGTTSAEPSPEARSSAAVSGSADHGSNSPEPSRRNDPRAIAGGYLGCRQGGVAMETNGHTNVERSVVGVVRGEDVEVTRAGAGVVLAKHDVSMTQGGGGPIIA